VQAVVELARGAAVGVGDRLDEAVGPVGARFDEAETVGRDEAAVLVVVGVDEFAAVGPAFDRAVVVAVVFVDRQLSGFGAFFLDAVVARVVAVVGQIAEPSLRWTTLVVLS
jgi:hypothetical protein